MRLLVDTLIALMLAGILAGVLLYHRHQTAQLAEISRVHQSLARLHEQAIYHGALQVQIGEQDAAPPTISPAWFLGNLPENPLTPNAGHWLDIAPSGDTSDHPPDPVVTKSRQAAFWYNPARGIFRARVSPQFSEARALALYNRLNQTALSRLVTIDDAKRQPQALASPAKDQQPAPVDRISDAGNAGSPRSADATGPDQSTAADSTPRPSLVAP